MNTGIPRVMYFTCSNCRLAYRAREEVRAEQHSGTIGMRKDRPRMGWFL
jgi:hypothetical protein